MSWFTEIRDGVVEKVVPEQYRNIDNGQIGDILGTGLVKLASSGPAGNRTAAEIAAGKTGEASSGVSPAAGASKKLWGLSVPVILGIVGVIYLAVRKK